MRYDIAKFEELVEQGYLRKSEKGDLVLYGYTDRCTFERYWNEYTLAARGLIIEKSTGLLVAKPFPKFFNLGETEETILDKLPMAGYQTFEKVDGSLGIIFNYEGKWRVATRGSFYSEQAVRAQEMLNKYSMAIPSNVTILAEIIYPENKIIVDYKGQEKLVMLGAYDANSGQEFDPDIAKDFAVKMKMEFAKYYDHTIEEMIEIQKTLDKNEEGFVVRFDTGLRVKIKGDEYLKLAKILSHMSPISFWEAMENGKVKREYLSQLPEEFRKEFEPVVQELEEQYVKVLEEINNDANALPTQELTPQGRKTIGLYLQEGNNVKHKGAMFSHLMGQKDNVNKYILKAIRPTGNVIKSFGE